MIYFDSHAHLTQEPLLSQVAGLLERAASAQVTSVLNICTDPASLAEGLRLLPLNAGATTPHDVEKEGSEAFPCFAKAAREKKLSAIGETGLDYHYAHSAKSMQQQFLVRYLHLAAETHLPVIFHCREAFSDLFSIADLEYPRKGKAVLHCFTGTMQEAEEVIRRGWYLSFSGIVTFKKSEALREIVKIVPLQQMLVETDSPFLAPQTKRGKVNEPSFLPETVACIAEVLNLSPAEVAKATFANAASLFPDGR